MDLNSRDGYPTGLLVIRPIALKDTSAQIRPVGWASGLSTSSRFGQPRRLSYEAFGCDRARFYRFDLTVGTGKGASTFSNAACEICDRTIAALAPSLQSQFAYGDQITQQKSSLQPDGLLQNISLGLANTWESLLHWAERK